MWLAVGAIDGVVETPGEGMVEVLADGLDAELTAGLGEGL